ncbi:OST-HTH/LOTUS domain-containing protein [Photobacterium damselae]|uniref:OST-HTH/LOTUS domain-containing protein n=1 Tax=Photobacterium damselae TaxID=38293 RepID=UPI0040681E75
MSCSKIYLGLETLKNIDIVALNNYIVENDITDCALILSNTNFSDELSKISTITSIFIHDKDSIDTNVVIRATEDANISSVDEMTFIDEKIFTQMKPYLERLGIKVNLLKYTKTPKPNADIKQTCTLTSSAKRKLTSRIVKKFKHHQPNGDSIQYSTLCSDGFSDDLNLKAYGYKKLIDLLEDLDFFVIERNSSSIVVKFPPKK